MGPISFWENQTHGWGKSFRNTMILIGLLPSNVIELSHHWWWQLIFFDFQPYLGKSSNLTSIFFKMGWFNHQVDHGALPIFCFHLFLLGISSGKGCQVLNF